MKTYPVYLILLIFTSCATTDKKQQTIPITPTVLHHVSADTMVITGRSVIFFQPDSVAMEKDRKEMGAENFSVAADDASYYANSAAAYFKQVRLPIVYANQKYLKFVRNNQAATIIQPDTLSEGWGAILFDPSKEPLETDLFSYAEDYQSYFEGEQKAGDTKTFAAQLLSGKMRAMDDEETFNCLDSLVSKDSATRGYYGKVFRVILGEADGALAESMGGYAISYMKEYPAEAIENYNEMRKEEQEHLLEFVAFEFYTMGNDCRKEVDAFSKEIEQNCSACSPETIQTAALVSDRIRVRAKNMLEQYD
jgi:hypothetical protein